MEGFPSPVIDNELCVRCGLCEKTCPALQPVNSNTILSAYGAQIKDNEILKVSTSGGLFAVFSQEVIQQGGVVFGCVWDTGYNAVIVKAETEEELAPMRGSKYVWSDASGAYKQVKDLLEKGRIVLFTGLPCQVAGLRSFLGRDYENLYNVSLFCGGAPSPLAFHAYLETITKKYLSNS